MAEQPLHHYPTRKSRIVPVRFERATNGEPSAFYPYIDDRGFAQGDVHGGVVGIIPQPSEHNGDNDIIVRLVRTNISETAQLFAVSSDQSIFEVINPIDALTGAGHHDIRLRGIRGGSRAPEKAFLQIRYNSETGPIIHELGVWVFNLLHVNITPHFVRIHDAAGLGDTPVNLDLITAVDIANNIWKPAGICFRLPVESAWQNWSIELSIADRLRTEPNIGTNFGREIDRLVDTNWVPNTVNIYCVKQIDDSTILGVGVSRSAISDPSNEYYPTCHNISNPCLVIQEINRQRPTDDIGQVGSTIAHEIGHFLRLGHPSEDPNIRHDMWNYRTLMYNFSLIRAARFDIRTGYVGGAQRCGGMVTLKDLSQAGTRSSNRHGLIARDTINSGQQY